MMRVLSLGELYLRDVVAETLIMFIWFPIDDF